MSKSIGLQNIDKIWRYVDAICKKQKITLTNVQRDFIESFIVASADKIFPDTPAKQNEIKQYRESFEKKNILKLSFCQVGQITAMMLYNASVRLAFPEMDAPVQYFNEIYSEDIVDSIEKKTNEYMRCVSDEQ